MKDQKEVSIELRAKELPIYSKDVVDDAIERILKHKQSTIKFKSVLSSASGAILDKDYSLGRISHNYFSDCVFHGASLEDVAGAGSIFADTKFLETNLCHATFQNSSFVRCYFEDSQINGCNMSECYFQDTTWKDCLLGGLNMTSSLLKDCRFIASKPGNLSDAVLENVSLENIRLTNMNLEFASFKKIQTDSVILAFSQLPYIFGGIQYIMETSDDVRISSHINSDHSISIDEYIGVLKDMEIFYSAKGEYFPLANIYLAFHQYEEALAAILCGIEHAAKQKDFRMCKYFCKLITENGQFSANTLHGLYQAICNVTPVHSLSEAQYYQYVRHMPEIRSLLMENPNKHPKAILKLESDISDRNSDQISLILSVLDELIHLNGLSLAMPSVSISHNSPIIYALPLCAAPLTILAVCALILTVISKVCKTYNDVAQAIIATQIISEKRRKAKKDQLEIQKLSQEIAKLEAENSGLQNKLESQQERITASGIIITHAQVIGQDFDPMKWL